MNDPLQISLLDLDGTVKLGDKERFDKEQRGAGFSDMDAGM